MARHRERTHRPDRTPSERRRLDVQFADVADVRLDSAASQVGRLVIPTHQTRDAVIPTLQVVHEECARFLRTVCGPARNLRP